MEAPEKKAQNILKRELGPAYNGQSLEEVKPFNYFGGFYLKSCNEGKIELKSDVLVELFTIDITIIIDEQKLNHYIDNPYGAFDHFWYTGFTSVYVSDALDHKADLSPTIIHQLIDEDEKRGTDIEKILSRVSTCLKSIDNGQFLKGLLAKCSSTFVGLWKARFDY